jgi:hypothetical protein
MQRIAVAVSRTVERAHEFVASYQNEAGDIPLCEISGMGHRLAHMGMNHINEFLRDQEITNIGDFLKILDLYQKYTPENEKVRKFDRT